MEVQVRPMKFQSESSDSPESSSPAFSNSSSEGPFFLYSSVSRLNRSLSSLAFSSHSFFSSASISFHFSPSCCITAFMGKSGLAFLIFSRASCDHSMYAFCPLLGALGSFLAFLAFPSFSSSPFRFLPAPPLLLGFSLSYLALSSLYLDASFAASSSKGFFSSDDKFFQISEIFPLTSVNLISGFSLTMSSRLASQKRSQADFGLLGAFGSFFCRLVEVSSFSSFLDFFAFTSFDLGAFLLFFFVSSSLSPSLDPSSSALLSSLLDSDLPSKSSSSEEDSSSSSS
mmetsp:Transcript_46611/g.146132  ORF Transcript_46611/g.146132 Transcript_46611/m.146132 type:complete len:285 (-) Transcript_46611:1538-2392(-)